MKNVTKNEAEADVPDSNQQNAGTCWTLGWLWPLQ